MEELMNKSGPKSWRPKGHVSAVMDEWLKKNPTIDQSTLVNLAVFKFVTSEQKLEAVEHKGAENIDDKNIEDMIRDLMHEHKHTLDKLK